MKWLDKIIGFFKGEPQPNLYRKTLNRVIQEAIADGVLTEVEKATIQSHCEKAGMNKQEISEIWECVSTALIIARSKQPQMSQPVRSAQTPSPSSISSLQNQIKAEMESKPEIQVSINCEPIKYVENESMPRYWLKLATAKKKERKLNEAIDCLKKAYSLMEKSDYMFSMSELLRLPLYLQVASRKEEALQEFQQLLRLSYPNRFSVMQDSNRAAIYDKMRLFWKREKNSKQVFKYELLLFVAQAVNLHKSDVPQDKKQLREHLKYNYFYVEPGDEVEWSDEETRLKEIIQKYLKRLSNVDFTQLESEIDSTLQVGSDSQEN